MGNEQSTSTFLSEEERARCFQNGYDAADEFLKGGSHSSRAASVSTDIQQPNCHPKGERGPESDHETQQKSKHEHTVGQSAPRTVKWSHQELPARPSPDRFDSESPEHRDPLANWNSRKERRKLTPKAKGVSENSTNTAFDGQESLFIAFREEGSSHEEPQRLRGDQSGGVDNVHIKSEVARTSQDHRPRSQSLLTAQATPAIPAKRHPTSALSDERRLSSFKIPRRERPFPSEPLLSQSLATPNSDERQPPLWYLAEKKPLGRGKNDGSGNADVLLASLKDLIRRCKTRNADDNALKVQFQGIRVKLHIAFFTKVSAKILKGNRTLDNEGGLPQLFDLTYSGGIEWPFDIKADAEELYIKWCSENFDDNLLHGIQAPNKGVAGGAKAIKPLSSKYVGNGRLVNGQWWPIVLCAFRDGAHGETIKGISGEKGKGAYSCFISGGGSGADNYPDIDEGDVVHYCGTDDINLTGSITSSTQLMLDSFTKNVPIRFIRSSKSKEKSSFAPEYGFRYDGLYDITNYEILDRMKQRHRFTLVRQAGQDPIRGGNGPESRPTKEEIRAYQEDKRMRGFA